MIFFLNREQTVSGISPLWHGELYFSPCYSFSWPFEGLNPLCCCPGYAYVCILLFMFWLLFLLNIYTIMPIGCHCKRTGCWLIIAIAVEKVCKQLMFENKYIYCKHMHLCSKKFRLLQRLRRFLHHSPTRMDVTAQTARILMVLQFWNLIIDTQ